jgi:ABC-type multidrug transport system fused ATPase/permease subunit
MEEIIEVCKQCQIHDKIMSMPDGYDTEVGELGSKLSGGERQRIVIARSLLKKDAKIFLFDEATSALDPKTEQQIADELDIMMKGKTVIYCAHRLSSIKNVDRIHVLKDGRVQESGNHKELFNKPGSIYRQMWNDYLQE